ncbi:MAG: hypothetical protein SGJ18_02305 [Pseudomonadota bacterium]|nr:hypothetical protein [Pseudomonadota bacterium]
MTTIFLKLFCVLTYASDFVPISFSDLTKSSSHIVIGTVVKAKDLGREPHTGTQEVKLVVDSYLKGEGLEKEVSIKLQHKGLVDFDPQLSVGDSGVFFLNKDKEALKLTFFGSIAVFPKKNFRSDQRK